MALMTMVNSGDTGDAGFDAAIGAAGAAGGYDDSFEAGVQMVESAFTPSTAGGDGQADIYGTSAPGAGLAAESGGQPAGLGENWLTEGFGKAMGWFDGQKDSTKGAMVTLAGSFLKGLFSYSDEQRKMKAMEKSSEASMLRATTEANLSQQKMANASSIGQTNFGAAPAGGLIYSNKLAERQKRAGGYGA